MLTLILPVCAAIICAFIEWLRIDSKHGKVANVGKFVSVNIAVILFVVCIALSVDYYDDIMPGDVLCYMLYYIGWRGMMYDITLNLLRGLDIDYVSKTTNSKIDRLFVTKDTFWSIKFVYLLIVVIFGYLWQLR